MEQKENSSLKNLSEKKYVLAIETSEQTCGVCIYFSDDTYFSSSVNLKHSHSELIFEIADYLFKLAAIKPEELDAIAVSEGPGSFTGLRIGYAAAKGIAYGAKLPIIPVPTYEVFAYQLSCILNENEDFIVSNKVNKDEVYFSRFQIKGNSFIFVEDLSVLPKEEFILKSKQIKIFGNSARLLDRELLFPLVPEPFFVAKWAVKFGWKKKTFNYDFLEPNYLKDFIVKEKNK